MGTPVALGALAGVLAVAAPRILGRRSWLHDAPKLGIAAWVSACGAFVLAVVGAGAHPPARPRAAQPLPRLRHRRG
jgi:hypothetical protein